MLRREPVHTTIEERYLPHIRSAEHDHQQTRQTNATAAVRRTSIPEEIEVVFNQVHENIKVQNTRENGMQSKELAFTKLITCGLCGSGITADEKYKKQKNGNVHRYVYYGCTKHNDKDRKCGYVNEEELIEQLTELMDKI